MAIHLLFNYQKTGKCITEKSLFKSKHITSFYFTQWLLTTAMIGQWTNTNAPFKRNQITNN
jgi:hypothetical protein